MFGFRLVLILFAGVCACTATLYGDDIDVAEEELAMARVSHEKALGTIRDEIKNTIESKIQTEEKRKNPDLTRIETLQKELHSLDTGAFPSSMDQKQKKGIDAANKKLVESLQKLKNAHIRAKDLEKAKKVDQEIQDLSSKQRGQSNQQGDGNWMQLFDGKDTSAWHVVGNPAAKWRVENGLLVGRSPASASILHTASVDYTNFHLRLETMPSEGANGGVFLRWTPQGGGVIVQYGGTNAGEQHKTGNIQLTEKLYGNSQTVVDAKEVKLETGKWYVLEVICNGKTIIVKVDGDTVAETNQIPGEKPGHIGLQCRGDSTVRFRKVEIQPFISTKSRTK